MQRTIEFRAVLVEDDPSTALVLRAAMTQAGVEVVGMYADGTVAAQEIDASRIDLLVSDVCLPGLDGLQLARRLKEQNPQLRTMLLTATPTVEGALAAYQTRVDDFLAKPCSPSKLIARLQALCFAPLLTVMPRSVLAIGAHPDDVELGCGGALARHRQAGDQVYILALTAGEQGGDPERRLIEAHEAAWRLGARAFFFGQLEDTRVSEAGATVVAIRKVLEQVKPNVVYTHSRHDQHQDHRAAYHATLIAARGAEELLCYQSPSCTVDFRPSRFIDVAGTLDCKLAALAAFSSQRMRGYLAREAIVSAATYWGRYANFSQVEPMEVVRQAL